MATDTSPAAWGPSWADSQAGAAPPAKERPAAPRTSPAPAAPRLPSLAPAPSASAAETSSGSDSSPRAPGILAALLAPFVSVCLNETCPYMQTGQASLLPGVPALLSDERRRSPLSNFRCLLLHFDFHLTRFRGFFLRKSHREYAVVKLGADLVGIEAVRHC